MRMLATSLTAVALLCAPIAAFGQQYNYNAPPAMPLSQHCAFSAKTAPEMGPKQWRVEGFICGNEEAAIAAARHQRDQKLTRPVTVQYVNKARHEDACRDVSDVPAKLLGQPYDAKDQFGDTLKLALWQININGKKFLGISAKYADRC